MDDSLEGVDGASAKYDIEWVAEIHYVECYILHPGVLSVAEQHQEGNCAYGSDSFCTEAYEWYV